MKGKRILLPILLFMFSLAIPAQRRNRLYQEYIDKYKDLAIEQMKDYHIPASITLSQGLLESRAGQSTLTLRSNNHFGIKCGGKWNGPYVCQDDDAPGERFRVYRNARESYVDHSIFLSSNQRYAFLFGYNQRDYRSWALGLKQAGYATSPSYATKLISIIEDYELYQYDSSKEHKHKSRRSRTKEMILHQVYIANDLAYVIAQSGDDFDMLSAEFDISTRRLRKYNEVRRGYSLQRGDIVYLHKKNKFSARYAYHVVKDGDSLYSISQTYGIQLKYLYKLNKLPNDYIPSVGDILKLR